MHSTDHVREESPDRPKRSDGPVTCANVVIGNTREEVVVQQLTSGFHRGAVRSAD